MCLFSFSSSSFAFAVVGGGWGETSFLQSTLYLVYLITRNNSVLFEKFRASSIRKVSYNSVALLTLQFICTVLLMHTWIQHQQGFIRLTITWVLTIIFLPDQRKEKASCHPAWQTWSFHGIRQPIANQYCLLHRTKITDHRNSLTPVMYMHSCVVYAECNCT